MWTLDPADGELLLHTGVTGRAARMGHRLTIAMTRWQATVTGPTANPSRRNWRSRRIRCEVLRGEGGVKGLSGPEKAVVRSNALKVVVCRPFSRNPVHRRRSPRDRRRVSPCRHAADPRKSREHVIDLRTEDLGDSWRMSAESTVRQTDYGVKPFSLLMGSVQVADDVTVSFTGVRTKKATARFTAGAERRRR